MTQALPKAASWIRVCSLFSACLFGIALLSGSSTAAAACPNESFRTGASAVLPDCRAYERITPSDSAGRLFFTIEPDLPYNLFPTSLLSGDGASAVFVVKGGALPDPPNGNGTQDVYQTVRTESGWDTVRRLTPSGQQVAIPTLGGVSPDHQYAFIGAFPGVNDEEYRGTLTEEGLSMYLGNPDGSFELVGVGSLGTDRITQGRFISEGGSHIIFTPGGLWCTISCTKTQLEPTAPPTGTEAIYDRSANGPTRVVSLLPGNVTPAAGEDAVYQGTSADGTTVAFTIGGTLYLRSDNAKTEEVTAAASTFAGLSQDGAYLFYVSEGNAFRYEAATGDTAQVATTGDAELANVSADGTHAYFLSKAALPGTDAVAGEPNLYVWTDASGETQLVATVSPVDLEGVPALDQWLTAVTPEKGIGQGPGAASSRTTPDGGVIAFESRAKLTGYDNEGVTEIYRYDASIEDLQCVSCGSAGLSANSSARFESPENLNFSSGGESMVIANLTADGERVFFETKERLVARDVDGVNDIYQWQSNGGAPSIDLISSGQSVYYRNEVPLFFQEPNAIFGISPSGNDVMFRTTDALLGGVEPGGVETIYDARVGGGLPEEGTQPCSAQNLRRLATSAPALAAPQSRSFSGHGNVKPRHRCHRPHGKQKPRKASNCRGHRHQKGSAK